MITTATEHSVELSTIECASCGITFGMPVVYLRNRRAKHDTFWCPNGHSLSFPHESDAEKAERLRQREERWRKEADARAVHLQDQLDAEKRSAAALRGHLTRARNRIANGVCPVAGCHRHFDNVQAHMTTVHPEYKLEEPTA